MKTKGITIVERHGEKAIVGFFALLALGVVAFQFVGAGNRVTIENNQKVEPDRAFDSITRKAQQVAGQIADPNPAPGIPENVPDAAQLVRDRIERGLLRADAPLPVALGISVTEEEVTIPDDARFAAIEVPAPSNVAAAQYIVTLNPLVVADSEALAAVAPAQQPYDLRAVSVQASFPAAEFRANLEEDPDGAGPLSPLPRTFWMNRTAILDVRLERQRVNADGSTGPVERVAPSPRAESFASAVSPGMSPGEFQTLAREARTRIGGVAQPPFPPTIAGDIWTPPAQMREGAAAVENTEMARLQRQLEAAETQRDDLERRIDAATTEQAKANLNARLASSQAEIDRLEARIVELDQQQAAQAQPNAQASPSALPEARNIETAQDIAIVAHDLTARPGETYRYRVSLGVTNPFFPWSANLQDDQRALAEEPVLYTEATEWSQPVQIAPTAQVFFTRAAGGQDASAVGGFRVGDASAEVFGLFYGHWRGTSSRLAPGDTLSASVPLPQGLETFVIDKPEEGAPVVVSREPTPSEFPVALEGAMLVDVIERSAGAARPEFIAVVRLPDGRLALRDPSTDQADPALARARRSAEAGQTATVADPTPAMEGGAPNQRRQQPQRPQGPARTGPGVSPMGGGSPLDR